MKKNERDFLSQLEEKAEDQKRLVGTEILPKWAVGIGEWLVVNPWRVLIPLAGMCYIALRILLGNVVVEAVLGLFGGFRL